ncbi:MAG: hypothetical protein KKF89_01560, partial [Nanoarchaeota archaeon]|nr:hypothetical protein [Nanoarchaeota archaeon]MBU1854384.1 hypothetical protein [Nanoarchaeota archaeon]
MGGLEGIIGTCDSWLTKHSRFASFLAGLATFSAFESLFLVGDYFVPDKGLADYSLLRSGFMGSLVSLYCHNVYFKGKRAFEKLGLKHREVKSLFKRQNLVNTKNDASLLIRAKDRVFEHPRTVGLVGAGLTWYYLIQNGINKLGWDGFIDNISDNYETMLPVTFLTLFLGYKSFSSLTSYLGGFFHSSNYSHFKDGFMFRSAKKNNDLKSMKELALDSSFNNFIFEYANVCVDNDHTFEAFDVLKQVYDKNLSSQIYSNSKIFSFISFREVIVKHLAKLEKNNESFANWLGVALDYLFVGEKEKSVNLIGDFVKGVRDEKLLLSAKVSEVVFLKNISEDELFRNKVYDIVKNHPDKLAFNSDGLCLINDNNYTRQALALKRTSSRKPLDDERVNTFLIKSAFDEVNDESIFRIVQPLEVIDADDYFYGAMNFEVGQTLYDCLKSINDFGLLKSVARFMARIHGSNKLADSLPVSYYKQQFLSRADEHDNPLIKDYLSLVKYNLDFLLDGFDNIPRVVDVDGHRFNWMIGNYFTKVDNEKRAPTVPMFE